MKFSRLAEYFGQIDATTLRNEKTAILTAILREAEPEEVDKLVYLALGSLRPAFDRLEFNMAEMLILRVMGATNEEYQKVGDLGELAASSRAKSRDPSTAPRLGARQTSPLQITEVYEQLEKIARDSGSGSQERKVAGLAKLIKLVEPESAKYIVRMVAGKLRLGFSEKTVIDALSYLENGTKEYSDLLDRVYQIRPDIGYLAKTVKAVGAAKAMGAVEIAMGTPIVPALAQRLKTPVLMIEKMGRVYCEPKYDGTRVQIHFSRKMESQQSHGRPQGSPLQSAGLFDVEEEKPKFWVRTFTRNLDESSAMFPELQQIAEQIKAEEVILDCEAVGYDPKTNKLVPFQLTITRKRKHGVAETASSVPLRFFVFDIMYRDGKSLINLPLWERRKILSEVIQSHKGSELGTRKFKTMGTGSEQGPLVVDDFIETDDPNVLRAYHKAQLEAGLEGALVKQVEGQYMPGRTGFNWVKFKEAEDSRAKLSDTIDCVIMGYYLGKGKRSDFGMGALLVGIAGDHNQVILTLAKVGTGITDKMFGELRERLKPCEIRSKGGQRPEEYEVPKILTPDVWVEPKVVVEVAADEITISPTHSAGYALRFPRLVKFRDDKSVAQITTWEEIKSMVNGL